MRIVFDARCVFRGMGGIGTYARALLERFLALDLDHEWICLFTKLPWPEGFDPGRHAVVRRFDAGMVDERFDQLVLPSVLEAESAELYFNPTFSVPSVGGRAARVSTVHDVVFRRHPELVEPRLRGFLDAATRRACRRADRIVTVSEFSKRELLALYEVEPGKLRVIPNGVTRPSRETAVDPAGLQALAVHPGRYVLYVGSLEPKKNLELLLEAFRRLPAAPEPATLVLAGSRAGDYPIETKVRELGLEGRVRLPGYVPSELLECLYAHAAAFVYPSLYEGFGLPPLEAMARGVPTIVADTSSLPEVVGDAAIVVGSRDAAGLAAALEKLLGDSAERKDWSRRGLERAAHFTWEASASAHLDVFESAREQIEDPASRV